MDSSSLKVLRAGKKRSITRHISGLQRQIGEDDTVGVTQRLAQMREKFTDLENTHYEYVDSLTEDKDIDTAEQWLKEVQATYLAEVKKAVQWVKSVVPCPVVKPGSAPADPIQVLSHSDEILHALHLPRVEIPVFDGKTKDFQAFITIFDELIDQKITDPQVKLTRLLQYLQGPAREAVGQCVIVGGSVGYGQARQILQDRFGSPHLIVQSLLKDLREGKPAIRPAELRQLADDIQIACAILRKHNMFFEVNTQNSILSILRRCSQYVKQRWRKKALSVRENTGLYPDFTQFSEFMVQIARDSCDPIYGFLAHDSSNVKKSAKASCNQATSNEAVKSKACRLCQKGHPIWECFLFKGMTVSDRYQCLKANRLCFNCLKPFHISRDCTFQGRCKAQGCGRKHHTLLHNSNNPNSFQNQTAGSGTVREAISANLCNNGDTVFLPILPVRVGKVHTGVLIDSGSTTSLISKSLVKRLGLHGRAISCRLDTVNSESEVLTKMVSFDLLDRDGRNRVRIHNALVVDRIPAHSPAYSIDKSKYPHLRGIDLPSNRGGLTAEILVGLDHPNVLMPLDLRRDKSRPNSMYAVLYSLGWVLYGSVPRGMFGKHVMVNFIKTQNQNLNQQVQNLWDLENEGDESLAWSKTDHDVIQFWDENTKYVDGHYEVPVPWKQKDMSLPDNKVMAQRRLKSNVQRLIQRDMVKIYDVNLNKMLSDGYAEVVTEVENDSGTHRRWYLPHHFVLSAAKPGKVRIVFDCAAKYEGISLNSLCHQGPDLVNKLLHVLLRFRQYRYAVTADVESMYHQVRIPVSDRDCFRFLWFQDGDDVTCRMTSHLFGGVWCASSSTYALRRTVQDFSCTDLARDTVLRSFYVDDMLRSANTKAEASEAIYHTKDVLSKGGFRLTKFVANDPELLSNMNEADVTQKIWDITPDYLSKALGIGWDVNHDEFLYTFRGASTSGNLTKRSILSRVASMYDPLGLVAPIVVSGRMIFQKATKLKLDWDDPIPSDLEREWMAWSRSLNDISDIRFPRCVIPPDFAEGATQLHFFCDASTAAYGTVCYVRTVNKSGQIYVGLLSSRVRLAPVKPVTIPRLELCAAVLAVSMHMVIQKELDLSLLPSVFWTDSSVVLAYIRNPLLRTKVFVANRVSFIQKNTDVSQWHFVSSKNNAADVLSRGCMCQTLPSTWIRGPEFLYTYRSEWAENDENVSTCSEQDLELLLDPNRREQLLYMNITQRTHPIDRLIAFHSSFYRLKKAICWLLRITQSCRSKSTIDMSPVTVTELGHAESLVVGHIQRMSYSSEIADLSAGRPLNKSSAIIALNPMLVNGLLVVGGRIKHANIPQDLKFPYILPSGHRLSDLILAEYHSNSHLGVEWVLGRLRSKFWIPNARNKLKHIKNKCVTCKRLYGKPLSQKMADLPLERCSPSHAAFQHTGVDCFGPFYVKIGRAVVKRYGCIYTCFATRAIHLEVLMGLDTQSFLNGFMRFCSRRGCPVSVRSDNGTNLVGAKTELAKAFRGLDRTHIVEAARRNDISWSFNPPLASHHGGAWERMIRTVRRVLLQILNPRVHLTDEILHTAFCEVENIVNSRPLTKCSDDPADDTPLTPNHFLLLQGNYPLLWGDFVSADSLRKRWCRVQELASLFWQRWVARYLPELQSRSKWNVETPNLKVGDLVMLIDENLPRGLWPLGLVQNLHFSSDNLVRSVTVKTKSTTLSRPITKLILLECD